MACYSCLFILNQNKPLNMERYFDKCHNFLRKRHVQLTQSPHFKNASKGACDKDLDLATGLLKSAKGVLKNTNVDEWIMLIMT